MAMTRCADPVHQFYNDIFAYRERERAGELIGPRVFSTGAPHLRTTPPIETMDGGARRLLVAAAAEAGLNLTMHGSPTVRSLSAVIDGYSGVEHALPVALYDDVATLIARSGTTLTHTYATLLGWNYMVRRHGEPWEHAKMRRFVPPSSRAWAWPPWTVERLGSADLDHLARITNGAARVVEQGGRVGMGSHGDRPGIGYHYEMWYHALGGMSNHDILRSATIVGATAIGQGSNFGSLEPGKLADLQILGKNPLEDIHHTTSIRYVMKNGRLYQADDLTEIWPRHEPLAPIYLWDRGSHEVVNASADSAVRR